MKLLNRASSRLAELGQGKPQPGAIKLNQTVKGKAIQLRIQRALGARNVIAIFVAVVGLAIGTAHFGVTHADPLSICNESGTISSSETWTTGCVYEPNNVEVPDGVTLTIDPGAIIKASGEFSGGIMVDSGGTLDVAGTSGSPVTFTSINDDTAGGASPGSSGSPAAGDYALAIAMNGGTANVQYTDFKYGTFDIGDTTPDNTNLDTGSDLTVTDSSFTDSYQGVAQNADNSLTLERNSFALNTSDSPDNGVDVTNDPDLSGVVLSGSDENTFTGSGQNVVASVNGSVPADAIWAVDDSSGAVLAASGVGLEVDGTLTLDDGVMLLDTAGLTVYGTLNIDPGAIIKASGEFSGGIMVDSGGTLDVAGTSGSPVTFTSINDDTAGGASPGSSGSPAAGDYALAIAMNGGTANVQYTDFKYGTFDIGDTTPDNTNLDTGSDLTVTDSSFTDSYQGVAQNADNSLTLERNSFALNTSDSPDNGVDVTNDPDLSGVVLSGSDENTFTGSGQNVVASVNGSVPADAIWAVDDSSGAVLVLNGNGSPAVVVDGAVDLYPGLVVKVISNGFDVDSDGTLNTSGSSDDPVVFTTINDSTIGGASNDNSSSTGSAGDYTAAIRFEEPSSSDIVSYAVFKYAAEALSVGITGTLNVDHSQFTNNEAAFDADTTTSTSNPILDEGLADICVWPYANNINISQSWFGSSGEPGDSVDLSAYVGLTVPDGYPGLSELYDYVTSMYPITGTVSDNTIPWTVWSCGIPDGPTVTFPVTDVNVGDFESPAIASSELWTASNLAE